MRGLESRVARLRLAIAGVLLVLSAAPVSAQTVSPIASTVVLTDGTTCRYARGATFSEAGARGNYSCDDGRWLLGVPFVRADGSTLAIAVWIHSGCGDYCAEGLDIVDVADVN